MSGVIDTGKPYLFQTSDVPNILARLAPGGSNNGELAAMQSRVAPYLAGGSHDYVPGETTSGFVDRGQQWVELATLFRYEQAYGTATQAAKYSNALIGQINEFSAAYDTESERLGGGGFNAWKNLDVGARAQNWVTTYYMMYNPADLSTWNTSVRNTFNNMLGLQGDFLFDNASPASANVPNQRLTGYVGLYVLAMTSTYSGFNATPTTSGLNNNNSAASDWLVKTATGTASTDALLRNEVLALGSGSDRHFRVDGGHFEQSTEYGSVALNALMRVAYLERAAGVSTVFDAANKLDLVQITNAYYEFADQVGRSVATGDTDADNKSRMGAFTLPAMYLDSSVSVNFNRPDFGQVLVGWKDNTGTTLADAFLKGSSERPSSSRADRFLPNSGFGMLRKNTSDVPTAQLTFDAGPFGSATASGGHGQYDLLNLELSAYGRRLIADPGYGTLDTWAHNTVTLVNNSNSRYVNHGVTGYGGQNDAAASSPTYFAATGNIGSSTSIVRGAHRGFNSLNPGTVAHRTVYSSGDANGAYVVMDWVTSPSGGNKVEVGFNLAEGAVFDNTSFSGRSGYRSSYGDGGGDVWVEPISLSGYNVRTSARRVGTDKPTASGSNDGLRFSDVSTSGTPNLAFLTLVVPFSSTTASLPSISVSSVNTSTGTIVISLGGASVTLDRLNPTWSSTAPPNAATSSKTFSTPPTPLAMTATAPASKSASAKRTSIASDVLA